jgi:hypothetical protein
MSDDRRAKTPLSLLLLIALVAVTAMSVRFASAGTTEHQASFVNQSAPPRASVSTPFAIVLTFSNTGNAPWDAQHVSIVCAQGSTCPWTPRSVSLRGKMRTADAAQDVKPGQSFTRVFAVTPPAQPGDYVLTWRMAFDGTPFGEPSTPVTVRVVK